MLKLDILNCNKIIYYTIILTIGIFLIKYDIIQQAKTINIAQIVLYNIEHVLICKNFGHIVYTNIPCIK